MFFLKGNYDFTYYTDVTERNHVDGRINGAERFILLRTLAFSSTVPSGV
jgi:hypothetical protein